MSITRSYQLPGSQKIHFKRHPRFGTWSVNFDKGGTHSKFDGEYQSFHDLYAKVDYYLQSREKNACTIGEEIVDV